MSVEYQVTGPPGTGKTTYLTQQVERAVEKFGPDEVVIGSLTRAAATEIRNRQMVDMPREHVGTLHSLCWHLLDRPTLAIKKLDEWNEENPGLKLTKQETDNLDDVYQRRLAAMGSARPENLMAQMDIYRAQMRPRDTWPEHVRWFGDKWFDWMESNGYMDFTMLIEQALEYKPTAPGVPSVLIGDECQDWSKLELALFRKWAQRADTVIMAGDPDQAIYTWRGADPRVFIDHPVPEENKVLLGKSYRLPSEPHKVAQQWIRKIIDRVDVEFEPQREGGSVVRNGVFYKHPESLLVEIEKEVSEGRTVMILGSCKYVVEPTMKMLKKEGIPFHNPYKTDSAVWNPLRRGRKQVMGIDRILSFIKPSKDVWGDGTTEWDTEDLKRWMTILKSDGVLAHGVKKLLTKQSFRLPPDYEEFVGLFADQEQAEHAVDVNLDWYMSSVLPAKQKSLEFPARVLRKRGGQALVDPPKVIVGTIHSVKGGEADTVIVFPDLSLTGWREYVGNKDGKELVTRMFYVAMTRTRDKLILCQPYSRRTVWW